MKDFIKKYCIGLTGGIATGKSTVAGLLRDANFVVIDADHLSRRVMMWGSVGEAAIIARFGESILRERVGSGLIEIDRKKLGEIVFRDPAARKDLEAIVHPLIDAEFKLHIRDTGLLANPKPFFYEVAILFELNMESEFRQVWCTYCSPDLQLRRLMDRNDLTREEAEIRIASQMNAASKALYSDRTIATDNFTESIIRIDCLVHELNEDFKK